MQYSILYSIHSKLLDQWNELVKRINKKGGEPFLEKGILPENAPPQFSPEDIETLIQLCHPDKHGGKESATRMTQMLLLLRK